MLLEPPGVGGGARVKAAGVDAGVMEAGNTESRQMGPIRHRRMSAAALGGGGGRVAGSRWDALVSMPVKSLITSN